MNRRFYIVFYISLNSYPHTLFNNPEWGVPGIKNMHVFMCYPKLTGLYYQVEYNSRHGLAKKKNIIHSKPVIT